jgi:hypothetical protein
LWVIFALLNPDPDSEIGSGYGSTDLLESGSNQYPDLEHCFKVADLQYKIVREKYSQAKISKIYKSIQIRF